MAKTTTKKKSPKKAAGEKTSAKKTATRKAEAATEPVEATPETPSTTKKAAKDKEPKERDPRLPEPGTVLIKKDRSGATRCECVVEADGVRYKGELFNSLSGAAAAAAKDLGLSSKANGFLFWGITKPKARSADPVATMQKAWQRYFDRVSDIVGSGLTEEQHLAAVEKHAEALTQLREVMKASKV